MCPLRCILHTLSCRSYRFVSHSLTAGLSTPLEADVIHHRDMRRRLEGLAECCSEGFTGGCSEEYLYIYIIVSSIR